MASIDSCVCHADGIVVDIGGTTTDVGVLQQGFPRPASREALLAGVRINQRVPDILSIGTSSKLQIWPSSPSPVPFSFSKTSAMLLTSVCAPLIGA